MTAIEVKCATTFQYHCRTYVPWKQSYDNLAREIFGTLESHHDCNLVQNQIEDREAGEHQLLIGADFSNCSDEAVSFAME